MTDTARHGLAGRRLPAFSASADRRRLRLFAEATGQEDPIYTDVQAAYDAGFADLPIPPTYLFSLEREGLDLPGLLNEQQIDLGQILHGEQDFVYHRVMVAGENLRFSPRMVDDYHKRGGALRFLVRETSVTSDGAPVAQLRNVIVVRRLTDIS